MLELKTIDADLGVVKVEALEFNKLSLFTGMNGTGKSIILVLNWLGNMAGIAFYKQQKNLNAMKETLQFMMDYCFTTNDFTGFIKFNFNHLTIDFDLKDGKVEDVECKEVDPTLDMSPDDFNTPIFMSTNTRLLSSIVTYAKYRKTIGVKDENDLANPEIMMKLLDAYKLQDVMFMERALKRWSDPFYRFDEFKIQFFKENIKKEITGMYFSYEDSEIKYTEIIDGKPVSKNACLLSNGEQSLLNMHSQHD